MVNQYKQTRTKRIDFCFTCGTRTPHRRVYGDYLEGVKTFLCVACQIEVIIFITELLPANGQKAETK